MEFCQKNNFVVIIFVQNIGTVRIRDEAENTEINAIENDEKTKEERFAEIKELFGKVAEIGMDWALEKGCEIVHNLQEKAKFGWTNGNECGEEQLGKKVAKICGKSDAKSTGGKAQNLNLGDQSALIATGKCLLEQMQTEERQTLQNAKGKEKLAKFDSAIKELSSAVPAEELAKNGLANLLKTARDMLRPSDLLKLVLSNKNNGNGSESEGSCSKTPTKKAKNGKGKRLAKRGEDDFLISALALDFYQYVGLIFALFVFGQLSFISLLLLLVLLPFILRPLNSNDL